MLAAHLSNSCEMIHSRAAHLNAGGWAASEILRTWCLWLALPVFRRTSLPANQWPAITGMSRSPPVRGGGKGHIDVAVWLRLDEKFQKPGPGNYTDSSY